VTGFFSLIGQPVYEQGLPVRSARMLTGGIRKLLTVAFLVSAAVPAAAGADSVKIGTSLQRPHDINALCATAGCVGVQRSIATGPERLPLTSPVGGRVTGWSVRSGNDGELYALRILRPTGGLGYTGAGTAFATSTVPTGPDTIVTSPTSLPIQAGDAIGLQLGPGSSGFPTQATMTGAGDAMAHSPSVPDGSNVTFLGPSEPYQLLLQATVAYCQVPNLVGLRVAVAIQQLTAHDCAAKVVKKPKRKKKKRGKVLRQLTPPSTTGPPGTEVTLVVGKKPKAKKKR
jgi:PASTA domain